MSLQSAHHHSLSFTPAAEAAALAALLPGGPLYERGQTVKSTRRSIGAFRAHVADVRSDSGIEVRFAASALTISVATEEIGGLLKVGPAGTAPGQRRARAASIAVIPANQSARGADEGLRFLRHLVLELDPASPLASEFRPAADGQARWAVEDPNLMRLCQLVTDECDAPETANSLYCDGLSAGLLRRLTDFDREPPALRKGGLTPLQLRRVTDFLVENLGSDVQLSAVAQVAGLSASHFSRAFKATTGVPPHRWLLNARCERAKVELLKPAPPLAELALDLGFCDQAHFCRSFTRMVGTSPGAWRRQRR